MSSEVRSFRFVGGATHDLNVAKTKRGGRSRKVGGDPSTEALTKPQIIKVGGATNVFPTSQIGALATPKPESQATAPAPVPTPAPAPALQEGGVKQIKVELKKHQSKKVKLHPKKEHKEVKDKPHTKKARKFVLGVSSLHKRMTRAKKVHHTIKKMPFDVLRKHLIQAKLIKETSKAPESILRQIAEDAQIVGKKML